MPQDRSDSLILVAMFLSRYGQSREGGSPLPPTELGTTSWANAYAEFFATLGEGRTMVQFHNTLKASRDQFDSHFDSGRRGWLVNGKPKPLPEKDTAIFQAWAHRSRAEHWEAIRGWADIELAHVGTTQLFDVDVGRDYADQEVKTGREGTRRVVISSRVERDPRLRASALKVHGDRCQACGFDFGRFYGKWGAGYAEVHHRQPLAAGDKGARETDVERDLVVLCANCHRMVHRKRERALSVEELREMISKNGKR